MASIAEDAAASTTLSQMRALCERIRGGARLTRLRNLNLADTEALAGAFGRAEEFDPIIGGTVFHTVSAADVPSVHLAWSWARAARLVRIAKATAAPSPRGLALGSDPLEEVYQLFDAFLGRLRWVEARHRSGRIPFYASDLCGAAAEVVRTIARARGAPLDLGEIAGSITMWLAKEWDLLGMTRIQLDSLPGRVGSDLWWGIAAPLGELGILYLQGGPPGGRGERARAPQAAITPLGVYAEARMFESIRA